MKVQDRLSHLKLVLVTTLFLVSAHGYGDWSIPEPLKTKTEVLNDEQQAFITSGTAIKIVPERQLLHVLETYKSEALVKFVEDIRAVAAQMGYVATRDMGGAPLNLTTDDFNRFVVTPPELRKMKREPGPFSVSRYLYPQSGVPTFGGAKVAIFAEDLIAGDVDVAIVGIPSDMGSGTRDAAWAPHEMRALNTIDTPDVQSLIRPFDVLSIVDYGTFAVDKMSIELSIDHVIKMVAETSATGTTPMMVGGDSAMIYPGIAGVAKTHGAGSFGVLHISAHPDVERNEDHTLSDRQALFRLIDDKIINGSDVVQLGLRGQDLEPATLQWLQDQGVKYHTMAEVRQRGFAAVRKRILREVERGPDAFFVAVDVSALAPSEMIAAGRTEVGGLNIEQVTRTIRHICAVKNIVGFELTDLAPMMDLSRLSVIHANALLNACLIGIALRESGLEPEFVHPLARHHGQR